mgnify:CR=1 FL=1
MPQAWERVHRVGLDDAGVHLANCAASAPQASGSRRGTVLRREHLQPVRRRGIVHRARVRGRSSSTPGTSRSTPRAGRGLGATVVPWAVLRGSLGTRTRLLHVTDSPVPGGFPPPRAVVHEHPRRDRIARPRRFAPPRALGYDPRHALPTASPYPPRGTSRRPSPSCSTACGEMTATRPCSASPAPARPTRSPT